MKILSDFKVALVLFCAMSFLIVCSSPEEAKEVKTMPMIKEKPKAGSPEAKISSSLRDALAKLEASGVTADNLEKLDPASLSASRVKIDEQGNLHCYIYLTDASDENIEKIKAHNVKIDLVNQEQKIVQAWMPFFKCHEIAKLSFVKQIKEAAYGNHKY